MFDGYVFIDQLPNNNSNEPAVHIYTRPFDLTAVKTRESLTIYTTALLKSVMICDEKSNVREQIEVINDHGLSYHIDLPNKESLIMKAFSSGSKTLNIIILFEYCDRLTLYAGRYKTSKHILNHKQLRKLMKETEIDDLWIDVTSIHIKEINLHRTACEDIVRLVKSRTHCKFQMLIDDFGYEDLIFNLATKGIKIYLDAYRSEIFTRQQIAHYFTTDFSNADILLMNHLDNDLTKLFYGQKIITIKLMADPEKNANSLEEDVHIQKLSIHPTLQDIYFIAHLTAPLHIYTIGEPGHLPFNLDYLCRIDKKI